MIGDKTRSEFIIENVLNMTTTLAGVGGVLLTGSIVRTVAGNAAGIVTLLVLTVYPVLVCYEHILLSETGGFFLLSLLVWVLVQFRAHWPNFGKRSIKGVYELVIIALGPSLLAYTFDLSLRPPFQAVFQQQTPCPLYLPLILLLTLISSWWLFISLKESNPIGLAMTGIPLVFLLLQVLNGRDAFPAYPLLIANCVTLLSLALRGWINKRIPGAW